MSVLMARYGISTPLCSNQIVNREIPSATEFAWKDVVQEFLTKLGFSNPLVALFNVVALGEIMAST